MNITASYILPRELKERLATLAEKEDMSASKYVKRVLMEHLKKVERKKTC